MVCKPMSAVRTTCSTCHSASVCDAYQAVLVAQHNQREADAKVERMKALCAAAIRLEDALKACVVCMEAINYSNRGDAIRVRELLQKIENDGLIPDSAAGRGEGV